MIVKRQVLLVIALAMLGLSLVFLSWVLQLPTREPTSNYRPAVGIVSVQVVSTATPTPDPAVVEYCSSYPKDLQDDCIAGIEKNGGKIPESPEDCSLVPEEMREECLRHYHTYGKWTNA